MQTAPARITGQHVAIITADIADALLEGRKTIETRFSRTWRPPMGRVSRGDLSHFKITSSRFIGTCRVRRLKLACDLTPTRVRAIRRQHSSQIAAPASYWRERLDCRYGLLLWLGPLRPLADPPQIPRQYGNGWLTLVQTAC